MNEDTWAAPAQYCLAHAEEFIEGRPELAAQMAIGNALLAIAEQLERANNIAERR